MKIVKDRKKLEVACDSFIYGEYDEAMKLGKELLKFLSKQKNGVGLAAPQVGIMKAVCVVNVIKPIIFINPHVAWESGQIAFKESCLSFPGKTITTLRYSRVGVQWWRKPELEHGKFIRFGPLPKHKGVDRTKRLLESVCIQHEIDHLLGITMFEKEYKSYSSWLRG